MIPWIPLLLLGGVILVIAKRPAPRTNMIEVKTPSMVGSGDFDAMSEPLRTLVIQNFTSSHDAQALRNLAMTLRTMGFPVAAAKLEMRAEQVGLLPATTPMMNQVPMGMFVPPQPQSQSRMKEENTTWFIPPEGGPPRPMGATSTAPSVPSAPSSPSAPSVPLGNRPAPRAPLVPTSPTTPSPSSSTASTSIEPLANGTCPTNYIFNEDTGKCDLNNSSFVSPSASASAAKPTPYITSTTSPSVTPNPDGSCPLGYIFNEDTGMCDSK